MPKIMKGQSVPKPKQQPGYMDLFRKVVDTDNAIIFTDDELPATGTRSLRATAHGYGMKLRIVRDGERFKVWVMSKGGV